MTDNEKRAHDIAVALLPEFLHVEMNKSLVEESNSTHTFNIYEAYKTEYDSMLKAINRDFPDDRED